MFFGGREEEPETSAFNTEGQTPFPPTYEDNKHIGEFSDERLWSVQKLLGRLSVYEDFLKRDDLMPRAQETARRIKEHILFELLYREGYFNETINSGFEPELVEHEQLSKE